MTNWIEYLEGKADVHISNQIKERKLYEKLLHKEHVKRQRTGRGIKK